MMINIHFNKIICLSVLSILLFNGNLSADERTGREFNELVKEMNSELSTAKQKVDAIEKQRLSSIQITPNKILPERAEALKKLELLKNSLDNAKTPEEKQKFEKELNSQILEVSKLSTDFVESMKNDLQTQDKQLEIVEDSLSEVVLKMNKLKRLVKGYDNGANTESARLTARRNLQKLAQMVELFAEKHKNAQQWTHIRKTIMLQNKILSKEGLSTDTIQKVLDNQQSVYEQVLAQTSIARRALQSEKDILAQVALGEIAKSMLRKTANLLLANENITNIGEAAFVKSELRQQQIMQFLEQDQEEGIYTGLNINTDDSYEGNVMPEGYNEYLNSTVN